MYIFTPPLPHSAHFPSTFNYLYWFYFQPPYAFGGGGETVFSLLSLSFSLPPRLRATKPLVRQRIGPSKPACGHILYIYIYIHIHRQYMILVAQTTLSLSLSYSIEYIADHFPRPGESSLHVEIHTFLSRGANFTFVYSLGGGGVI